jgi:mediator of RNA polymerase II transcription subunit 5
VGLQWLTSHLWQSTTKVKFALSLLQSFTKPSSSTEAREIHQTILSLVGAPISLQLKAISNEDPQKQVASAIMLALEPYMSLNRNFGWTSDDLQPLTASSGGLVTAIGVTFHQLLDWSTSLEVNASPPKFTFKFVSAAVQVHGASKVLLILMREIKMLFGTDKFDAALDMLTSIVCAPSPGTNTSTHCLSFRDALKIFHADLAKTLKAGDTILAELIVRLHQRVEASSAIVPQQEMPMDPTADMGPDLSNVDLQNINLDAAAANAEIDVAALGVQPTSEDIDQILEGATGMENFGESSMGPGTDDMFGLEGEDMQMINFDDMDLEGMF